MKKILLASLGVAALAGPAVAADMPVKAPPVAVVTWSGCYVGSNIGGSFGRRRDSVVATSSVLPGVAVGLPWTKDLNISGVVSGAQIGCNWQWDSHWVFGIEGDFDWASQHDEKNVLFPFASGVLGDRTSQFIFDVKERWFATARARIGYATDKAFWYITGGGAWADLHAKAFNQFALSQFVQTGSATFSGFTVGAGVEWWLIPNVSAKVEYLYADLGRKTFFVVPVPVVPSAANESVSLKLTDHIVRIGLNYHFNLGAPAVRAAY